MTAAPKCKERSKYEPAPGAGTGNVIEMKKPDGRGKESEVNLAGADGIARV